MKTIHHFFDLDGTLVDSLEATLQAYASVGIEFGPQHWGKASTDWNCPEDKHKLKTECYAKYAHLIELGWAFKYWSRLQSKDRSLLTAASKLTYEATKERCLELAFDLNSCRNTYIKHGVEMKTQVLEEAVNTYDVVYYYEDVESVGLSILKRVPTLNLILP